MGGRKTNINEEDFVKISPEELKDLGDYALGLKLLVKCREATYVGVCNDILSSREVFLEQVTVVSTGRGRFGVLILFFEDILSINIIGVNAQSRTRLWKEIYGSSKRSEKLSLMKRILPPSLSAAENSEEGTLFGANFEPEESDGEACIFPDFADTLVRPQEWKLIDSFEGEDFQAALHDIQRETVVSIFGCGVELGRRGTLAWLCMGTCNAVYLCDVAKLGVGAFLASEVGAVLRDANKVKVVHDGRRLEDYLYHQHRVNLVNVFDTEASHIYSHMTETGAQSAPLLVKPLSSLLRHYLECPPKSTLNLFPDIEDESMWLERPTPPPLLVFLVHSAMFLRELRAAMLGVILATLSRVNEVFLASLRDKQSALVDQVEKQIVPPEIQRMFKQSLTSKSIKINYNVKQNCK